MRLGNILTASGGIWTEVSNPPPLPEQCVALKEKSSQNISSISFQECIEWAKEEKRTFLRQSLESRLVGLFYETERYSDALQLGSALLRELKKLDDKNLLVEV